MLNCHVLISSTVDKTVVVTVVDRELADANDYQRKMWQTDIKTKLQIFKSYPNLLYNIICNNIFIQS